VSEYGLTSHPTQYFGHFKDGFSRRNAHKHIITEQ